MAENVNRSQLVPQPNMYIGDSTGRPLDYGMVYFGKPDKDPEFYPIEIFADQDLTVPLAQPVRTKGGYLYDKGDVVRVYSLNGEYSVKVKDQYNREIYYVARLAKASIGEIAQDQADYLRGVINTKVSELNIVIDLLMKNKIKSSYVYEGEKTQAQVNSDQAQLNSVLSNFKASQEEINTAQTATNSAQAQTNALLQSNINSVSGGYIGSFATLSELNAKTGMTTGQVAKVMNDPTTTNNGDYRYTGSAWIKGYSPVDDAKSYIDTKSADLTNYVTSKTQNIATQPDAVLDVAQDKDNNVYRYTAADGSMNLSGLTGSVQSNINALNKTANIVNADALLDIKTDSVGQVYAYTDASGVEYRFADIVINGKSVLSLEQRVLQQRMDAMYQDILSNRYEAVKSLVPIATKAEDGLIKRMPFCIKTPTGLVYFYHKQISGYDGDASGSELWKAIINIDDDLNVTVVSRELFLAPDAPRGIVKHPMLGRTSDNRIILMYEKRVENTDNYVRYQCYSSDEGLTFTTPTMVSPSGTNPAGASGNSALGTTGTIVTAKNGRLIVPMYTTGGTCYCIYSDNDGQTWTFSAWANPSAVSGYEPSISLDMDDNLVMDVRPKTAGYRLKAKSIDNGATWQAMSTQQVPSATNQGVVFRDKSIGLMIQANNAEQSNSRIKYSLFLSYDNLATFPFVYMPFAPSWYGGYSQIIKWVDGVYIIAIEYADTFIGVNSNENAGFLILSIKEVLNNVSIN